MNDQLKNELLSYYGELLYDFEHSNDYFDKCKISEKINAINTLLELPQVSSQKFQEIIKKIIKNLKNT